MKDERDGELIRHDVYGRRFVRDENGNERPPMQAVEDPKSLPYFSTYDTSQGHCGLCGRLDCNGGCFK